MQQELKAADGQVRAADPPFGASVLVHRRGEAGREFLVLHRSHRGADYEGDWAWTPPSGARLPGEQIEACAQRELLEEAGIRAPLRLVPPAGSDWIIFEAEVSQDINIEFHDPEHDRFEWVQLAEASLRCLPANVSDAFRGFAAEREDA